MSAIGEGYPEDMSLKQESTSPDDQEYTLASSGNFNESNAMGGTSEQKGADSSNGTNNVKNSFRRVKARSSRACEV